MPSLLNDYLFKTKSAAITKLGHHLVDLIQHVTKLNIREQSRVCEFYACNKLVLCDRRREGCWVWVSQAPQSHVAAN